MTPVWYDELRNQFLEYWTSNISLFTVPKAFTMLSSMYPPTIEDVKLLDKVNPYQPGSYIGGLEALEPGHHDHIYVGSATAPGQGLSFRISQHEDPNHRKKK